VCEALCDFTTVLIVADNEPVDAVLTAAGYFSS
jgi:hypothetical protein